MSDKELSELVNEYKDYRETGSKMSYQNFIKLFDELFDRHTQHQDAIRKEIWDNRRNREYKIIEEKI